MIFPVRRALFQIPAVRIFRITQQFRQASMDPSRSRLERAATEHSVRFDDNNVFMVNLSVLYFFKSFS